MKQCPNCGSKSFLVSAHVVQDWVVDEDGDFISVYDDCVEVAHFPDDDDIWGCNNCGYSRPGREFNIEPTTGCDDIAPTDLPIHSLLED